MDSRPDEFSPPATASLEVRTEYALVRRIMHVVTVAVERWRAEGCPRFNSTEVSITAALLGLIRGIVDEEGLALEVDPERVLWDEDIINGRRDPMTAARLDLSLRSFGAPAWHFTLECKRLGAGATARNYVEDGILDFVRGKYAAAEPWGGMLGYVVSGSPSQWFVRVNEVVHTHAELGTTHELRPRGAASDSSTAYGSVHERVNRGAVALCHEWFALADDLRNNPPHPRSILTADEEEGPGERTERSDEH